jgi:hypothetical protein
MSNLRRKMIWQTCRKKLLIVTFADEQTAQRPQMSEMKSCEDVPIAKIRICKNLREEPVNQAIQIYGGHIAFLS